MEYLMTYGWAILIVAVVLGALYSLGIFNGSNFLGGTCVASPGYLCSNPLLATDGTLSLTYGYQGPNVTVVGFACTNTTTAPSSFASSGSSNLEPGQEESVSVSCPLPSGATIGTPYSGYLWVEYDQAGQSDLIARFATVRSTASTSAAQTPQFSVIANVPVGTDPNYATYDSGNGYVYVPNLGSGTVSVISGTSVVNTVIVGSNPYSATYDSGNGYVYVPNEGSGAVSVLSGTSVINTVPVGTGPNYATYDSGNGYVYVMNDGSGTVSVLSGTSVVSTVTIGTNPEYAAYDPSNGYIYVPNYGSGTVSVLSGTSVVNTVTVGSNPYSAAYDSGNGYVYVTNYGSDTVSVISTT